MIRERLKTIGREILYILDDVPGKLKFRVANHEVMIPVGACIVVSILLTVLVNILIGILF